VPFVVTCAQCREEVLEVEALSDEEECAFHLLGIPPEDIAARGAQGVAQALRRQ